MPHNCPLCQSSSIRLQFYSQNYHGRHLLDKTSRFKVFECLDCRSIFLKDIVTNDAYYRRYYSPNYYQNTTNFFLKIFNKVVSRIRENQILSLFQNKPIINILDVGCGDGQFLDSLLSPQFKKNGLDLNPQAIKICQQKGINVFKKDITIFSTPLRFNVITLNHVLEHLPSPHTVLKNISQIIHPHGFLLITVPLRDSIGFYLGQKYWFHLDSPRHVFIPSGQGLSQLLKDNGFKIIKISRQPFEFPLDLFWSLIKYPYYWPLLILYPFIKLIDYETATFICQKS